MERYGATPAMEGIPVDPVAEWAAPGGETGLEKPMWRLGLTADGGESYPERAGEPDCIYYVRTGFCGYGNRCRFNHPRDRSAAMGSLRAGGVDYPERAGQPACQYYMRTGMCKFGASCKYHHPKQGIGSAAALTLNLYGYPSRLGEKECTYYVKTGQCKFGVTCKFHHPQPAGIQEIPTQALAPVPTPSAFPTMQSPLQSSQQYGVIHPDWPVPRQPPMLPGSYVPGSYPFIIPQGVLPVPGWTPYQAPVSPITSPSTQTAVGAGQITSYTGPFLSSSSLGPTSSSQKERAFPERPGEPECQYYLRTGDCKFGVTCKYHHPPGWAVPKSNLTLSPMGLPLRPGVSLCSHYAQNGVCKFGPSCKYDHPMGTLSYSPSASSLTDMPVAPYAIGSTNMTLAPSFSSSDMSPQAHSGFIKDPPQMSSMITASIGSLFSTGGVDSHQPSPQQSGQGTTSSVAGNGTDHGDEGHSSN